MKSSFRTSKHAKIGIRPEYESLHTSEPIKFLSSRKFGLLIMITACVLFSIMNTSVYTIRFLEPDMTSLVISFFRICINFLILVIPALIKREVKSLFGDCSASLWLRGLFGSSALILSFMAITRIGAGESAFLGASSSIFVALLSPWLLKQKNSLWTWLAILGAFSGVALLFKSESHHTDFIGRAMALGSGFLAALAYIMVSRAGQNNSTQAVIFYFCLIALLLHVGYFAFHPYSLPNNVEVWGLLIFTGLVGSGAQYTMTLAYQSAPASLVSAVSYLSPVLSLLWGAILFKQIPNLWGFIGAALILLFGVLLPFLRAD